MSEQMMEDWKRERLQMIEERKRQTGRDIDLAAAVDDIHAIGRLATEMHNLIEEENELKEELNE